MKPTIMHVAGARPNFMKVAPVLTALDETGRVDQYLVHTGQHYDEELSGLFFDELGLPEPDVNLGVGSGSHAEQTAEVMVRAESVIREVEPDRVFVVGDVNSTIATALTAVKLGVPVAHVEAGLRSGDRSMPEEINRILTDQLADALFTTEESAGRHLREEGIDNDRIHFVGNVMIDTLDRMREKASARNVPARVGVEPGRYVLVTLHRPGNVDDADRLEEVLETLDRARESLGVPVLFPVHPRTRQRIDDFGLGHLVERLDLMDPLGYLDFLSLMEAAGVMLTDSGGIQEETTVLGVPCVTLRPNTERPVTIEEGTNELFTGPLDRLPDRLDARLGEERRQSRPPLWDGRAGQRIADITVDLLAGSRTAPAARSSP